MKVVCHSCNVDFENKNKNKFICPSCGQSYNIKEIPDIFNIKLLNGVLIKDVSFNEVKTGIKTGKFLKVDYISAENMPWMKIVDSPLGEYVPASTVAAPVKSGSSKSWVVLFVFSFIVNIVLLGFLYLQKLKIDDLIQN